MISSRVVFILYIPILVINIFLLGAQATTAKPRFPTQHCEYGKGNFSSNSTYQANLNRALSSLVQSTHNNLSQNYGFFSSSQGQIPNKAHALGLCRGDSGPNVCRDCLENTWRLLERVCASQKEAIGGFEHCVLHYSNPSSNGTIILTESQPRAYSWDKTTIPSEFSDIFFHNLSKLLDDLRSQASEGGRFGKYSTGNISTGLFWYNQSYQTIYGLAQCRPDLSPMDCNKCLGEDFSEIRGNDHQRVGGRVMSPSCNFRYEVYRFYGDSYEFNEPPKSLSPPPRLNDNNTTFKPEMRQSKTYGAGGMVVTVASVSLIISIGVYYRFKKTNLNAEVQDEILSQATDDIFGCEKFDFGTIKAATNNFSEKNKIGTNIFGSVYMGRLSNGKYIAVKRLNYEHRDLFKNEVRFGAKLHHRNLVRLIGFCSKGDKKFLVNEYFPMNLECLMFDI